MSAFFRAGGSAVDWGRDVQARPEAHAAEVRQRVEDLGRYGVRIAL
ncbi:MAG: hypothetical protein ACXWNI_05325 [Candidatus Limnocylindrales bacterium]